MKVEKNATSNSCAKCGKPSRVGSSGTLTGWIFDAKHCRCDLSRLESLSQTTTTPIVCLNCGKALQNNKKATITQWIFPRDCCSCGNKQTPSGLPGSSSVGPLTTRSVSNSTTTVEAPEIVLLPQQGEVPERYQLTKEVGRGAKSVVYEAFDQMLHRKVAIKIMDKVALDSSTLVSFQNEAKVTCRLDHPNIVRVLDFGVNQNNQAFMVLELVSGVTLRQLISEEGPLDNETACEIFKGLASALAHAEKQGIHHRDLKPENIIIQGGQPEHVVPKLIDFGLAKIAESASTTLSVGGIKLAGTPAYMSADQANGLVFDVRSEIYSFGCVLFEALTGRPVFSAETSLRLLALHRDETPDRVIDLKPDIAPELDAIVDRCLQKSPDDRFQNFEQIVDLLEGNDQIAKTVENRPDTSGRKQNRFSLALIVLLACFGVGAIFLVGNQSTKRDTSAVAEPSPTTIRSVGIINDMAEKPQVVLSNNGTHVRLRGDFEAKDFSLIPLDKKLVGLDALDGQHLDPEGFQTIARLPLSSICLTGSDADDRIAHCIAGMKTVNRLLLKETNITDNGLIEILSLPLLKELVIDRCNISDKGISAISKCKNMTRLSISGISGLSATGLKALRSLPMNIFVCCDNKLTNEGLQEIAQTQAFELDVSGCDIDDDKAKFLLSKTSRVKVLTISQNAISLQGLATLLRLPSITSITLSPAPGLTTDSIEKLKRSLHSRCRVNVTGETHKLPNIDL